jgi:thymidylate synthase
MVNAWNVGELDQMTLPPCHYGFQCYVREGKYLSLMWNQRSVDTFLGLPFNIASYGLLLTILAKEVNMIPDQLIGNLGDTHLYLNHIEQAKEQIGREPFELPTLNQFPTYEGSRPSIESYVVGDFTLKDYQSHPSIKAPLSN